MAHEMTDRDVDMLHVLRRGVRGMLLAHIDGDIEKETAILAAEGFLITMNHIGWDTDLAEARAQQIFEETFPNAKESQ